MLFTSLLLLYVSNNQDVTAADNSTEENDDFQLTILHTNDVHARIEEFNKYIGECRKTEKCFGGMARLSTAINEIRSREDNVVLLDGGDQFQGTLWYNTYKWRVPLKFMNYIKYDAMVRFLFSIVMWFPVIVWNVIFCVIFYILHEFILIARVSLNILNILKIMAKLWHSPVLNPNPNPDPDPDPDPNPESWPLSWPLTSDSN